MTKESLLFIIKAVAAVLLLTSFFMPLSSCRYELAKDAFVRNPAGEREKPVLVKRKEPDVSYAYELLDIDDYEAWLIVLAFTWPIPLLLYERFGRRSSVRRSLIFLGLLLCIGSGYMVWAITFAEDLLYGAYVAFAALVCFFAASLLEAYFIIRGYSRRAANLTPG
jgi:hypothetical protein